MMRKISVLIPCYNVERYISRCTNSLLHQTMGLEAMELIFINDASTDNTLSLLLKLEEEYPENILVINLEQNMRQGGARNAGLQYASGEYIGFVDSDDFIELDMFEKLYEKAAAYDCDMVGGLVVWESGGKTYPMPNHLRKNELIEIGDDKRLRMDMILNGSGGGFFSKIYRKQMLLEWELFFPEQIVYEDNHWLAMVCLYINRYYIVDSCVYHYVNNPSSTVHRKDRTAIENRLTIGMMNLAGYAKRGFLKDYYLGIEALFCRSYYVDTLREMMNKSGKIEMDLYERMRTEVKRLFPEFEKSSMLIEKDQKLLKSVYEDKTKEQLESMIREYEKSK